MSLKLTHHGDSYFLVGVEDPQLRYRATQLRWQPHPADPVRVLYTRSPYYAAPFYSFADPVAEHQLRPFAWNYASSFAETPLQGTGIDGIRLPAGSEPYPFQLAGIQRASMRRSILVADEMGLGKSMQGLGVANIYKYERILIGCPSFLALNWAEQCEKWLVDPRSVVILDKNNKMIPPRGVVILPYSRGHTYHKPIMQSGRFNYAIWDEVHYLKSHLARRSIPWLGLHERPGFVHNTDHNVALSGTPLPNNPLEIYGLLAAFTPELVEGVTRADFKATYCDVFEYPNGLGESISYKFEDALNTELRASGLMIRRMKENVLKQLPRKHQFLVHLTPTAEIAKLVREEANLYEMLQLKILTARELMGLQGHIMAVRRELGIAKAPKVAEYILSIFNSGEIRCLCFMLHTDAINAVAADVQSAGIHVEFFTGAESVNQRKRSMTVFQNLGDRRRILGLCQTKAAGLGLTMTASRWCVLGEMAWSPADNDQAIDRVHRIGQLHQVEAPIVTFPHAVEERVLRRGAEKSVSARHVLDVNLSTLLASMGNTKPDGDFTQDASFAAVTGRDDEAYAASGLSR